MDRLAHAYIVQRLLSQPDIEVVLDEDIEVFDLQGNPAEAVVVGTYGQAFFDRAKVRLRRNPQMTQRIVSLTHNRPLMKSTLEEAGFSYEQSQALLPRFVVEKIDEPPRISDAMHVWLHHARGRRISGVELREVPEIAGRAAEGEAEGREIDEAFARSNVVVIHGGTRAQRDELVASYMRSGMPNAIRDASLKDARKLGVPLLVRVEERIDWTGEVETWRRERDVRVLASAPEAYWQRAQETGVTLLWADVALPPADEPVEEPQGLRAEQLRDVQRYGEGHADLIREVHARMPSIELTWSILDPAGLATHVPSLSVDDAIAAIPEYRDWFADVRKRRPAPVSYPNGPQSPIDVDAVHIEDDGEHVTAHWIAPVDEDVDLEKETIRRLNQLRRAYPERRRYSAHAHATIAQDVIRTANADEFPNAEVMRLHFHYSRLTPHEDTFDTYAEKILALRRRIVTLANRITAALTTYFRRDKPVSVIDLGVAADEWDFIMDALRNLPKLPRYVVDAWGFEAEGAQQAWSIGTPFAHAPYVEALNAYAKALHDFFNGSWQVFAANPQIGRGTPEAREKIALWMKEQGISPDPATVRLADVIAFLKRVQREFDLRFESDSAFDRQEHAALWQLWAVWYDFAYHPRRRIENAARDSVAAIDARIEERRRSLRRRFRTLELSRTEIHAENEQGLWLTVDVPHAPQVINAFAEALVQTIDVLRPPTELHAFDRYALDLVWGTVHLVPLVRGKSLAGKAWSLRILDLPKPEEKLDDHAWKFLQHDVENWSSLGLAKWPAAIATDARKFAPAVQLWRDTLTHLTKLRGLPENEKVEQHWRHAAEVAEGQSAEVARILEVLPRSLFADNDDAVGVLQNYVASVRERIASIPPFDFEAMEQMRAAVAETLSSAAATIGDLWIERELG